MSISTLPHYFIRKGKKLLLTDGLPIGKLPDNMEYYESLKIVSPRSFRYFIRHFNAEELVPEAILINVDTISITRLVPFINSIKARQELKIVPIIALKSDYLPAEIEQLVKMGFSDCFSAPVDWVKLDLRIKFLNKYKCKLSERISKEERDLPYKMPLSKRTFDIVVSSVLLLFLFPFFLLVALLIKLESRGPVFYISKRVGTGYQIFDFIKFRSMEIGAEATRAQLSGFNNYSKDGGDRSMTFFKMRDDPRVTWVGKIIRKTSIDELPQLINVLRGEMSIVGNRPLPLY